MTAEKIIALARQEVGYLEKKSDSRLEEKTANAGNGNFTKYAREMDGIAGFYNGKKNGFPWCDVFVDWLFYKAFGAEQAKALLCQPDKSLGAGCGYSAAYYKAKDRFRKSHPQPGDQIFFSDGQDNVSHTGVVTAVEKGYVHTVEGNTTDPAGRAGVWEKQYALDDRRIYGYGRPAYDKTLPEAKPAETKKGDFTVEMRVLKSGCRGDDVRALQILLRGNGWNGGTWGADGNFGTQTQEAVRAYQKKKSLQVDGMAGPETMGTLLGVNKGK